MEKPVLKESKEPKTPAKQAILKRKSGKPKKPSAGTHVPANGEPILVAPQLGKKPQAGDVNINRENFKKNLELVAQKIASGVDSNEDIESQEPVVPLSKESKQVAAEYANRAKEHVKKGVKTIFPGKRSNEIKEKKEKKRVAKQKPIEEEGL